MINDNKQEDINQENEKQDKIYWHDAFYAALQLELNDYITVLSFEDERQLSKEALAMDVLIIKKTADVSIDKNIGRIFKGHNIFEYKSEKDTLSVWDYNKVAGYAFVYSAFEKVPIEDMTISFVVTPKPVKLFGYLENTRGFRIVEANPGIYYIEGDTFKVQVIESKRLLSEENVFLRNLRSSLTHRDMEDVFKAHRKYDSLEKVNIYLYRVLNANLSVFKEVLDVGNLTLGDVIFNDLVKKGVLEDVIYKYEDVIYGYFEKKGTLDRIARENQEKAKYDTAVGMLRDGFTPEKVAYYVQMPVEWVQNLTETAE